MNQPEIIGYLRQLPEDTTLAAIVEKLRLLDEEGPERVPTAVLLEEEALLWIRTPTDPQDALMIRTFYASGIRGAELRALRKADLFGDGLFIRSGKYDADRYVLIDPTTAEMLREWTKDMPLDELIFKTSNSALQRHLAKWSEACGLRQKYAALGERVCAHSLRHSFATHCWRRTMDFLTLQHLLGHQLGSTTDYYIKSTLEDRIKRYHQAVGRASAPVHYVFPAGSPHREEVIAFILAETPATADLEAILEVLARWLLSLTRGHHREFMQQLQGECPAHELLGGRRLPLIMAPKEVHALEEAGGPAVRFLYRSLAWDNELPHIKSVHPETGVVDLGNRLVIVDLDTAGLEIPNSAAGILEAAERTGLAARFRAVGREFTTNNLRHSGATHILEDGLDLVTLHELLGNRAFVTTEFYLLTAAERWRPEYLRTHPLAGL